MPVAIDLTEIVEEIERVYDLWAERQNSHLLLTDELAEAKFNLARTIDAAYFAGSVYGKNEREREAQLRRDLSAEHGLVDELERKVRVSERGLRDAEIAAERLRHKIAVLTYPHTFISLPALQSES